MTIRRDQNGGEDTRYRVRYNCGDRQRTETKERDHRPLRIVSV